MALTRRILAAASATIFESPMFKGERS